MCSEPVKSGSRLQGLAGQQCRVAASCLSPVTRAPALFSTWGNHARLLETGLAQASPVQSTAGGVIDFS